MAKSDLIKKLTNGDVSLENALERLLIITNELGDAKVKNWILNEIKGYDKKKTLPNYRKNQSMNIKYDGRNGNVQVENAPLPITHFPKEVQDQISKVNIIEGISVVEKITKNNFKATYDLTVYAPLVYKETGIECLKITHYLSMTLYEKVYSEVRIKVIQILLDLEKEFGNLDALDINVDELSEEKIEDVNNNMVSIISDGKEIKFNEE